MSDRHQLVLLGTSHHVAPLEVRERLALTADQIPDALAALRRWPGIEECVILSTCNRTELYAVVEAGASGDAAARESLISFLLELQACQVDDLSVFYYLTETDVARHLFRVASGLDSMILGEVEILGQTKSAFEAAQKAGAAGTWLQTLFRQALKAAKRAQTETAISHDAASVSSAAVAFARTAIPTLARSHVLLVGAGATAELTAKTLAAQGVEGIVVINRTRRRAERLAEELNGIAGTLDDMLRMLVATDIVITSTDAPHAVLTATSVAPVLPARHGRPLVIIDLAVPRDVEPEVGRLPGVSLYNLDDLEAFIAQNLQRRAQETSKVDAIIVEEVNQFVAWQSVRKDAPTNTQLRHRAEEVRRAELERVSQRLSDLSDAERAAVDAATRAIVNKMLHHPISLLKESALAGEDDAYTEMIASLFDG